jgi:membrane-associated phospholipid phosphatase
MHRACVSAFLSSVLLAASGQAQEQAAGAADVLALGAPLPDAPGQPLPPPLARSVEWRPEWHRVRSWEYAATAAALAAGFGVRFFGPSPPHQQNAWQIEGDISGAVALRGDAGRFLQRAGDIGYMGSIVYRFVDSALVPSIFWGAPDVAWQMTMIDLEAFSMVAAVIWGAQAIVGRERPRFRDCPAEARDRTNCDYVGDNRYRSFISGHFTVAVTGASLTCVHHAHIGLYGGGVADDLACGTHIAAALTVGAARFTGEEHYLSDTLLGGALGVFAGYVLPSALHYGFDSSDVAEASEVDDTDSELTHQAPLRVTLLPLVSPSEWGVSAVGLF